MNSPYRIAEIVICAECGYPIETDKETWFRDNHDKVYCTDCAGKVGE